MPRALKPCSTPGCPELVRTGRCSTCTGQAEQQRGTAAQRGYGARHRRRFRTRVLQRNPLCVCVDTSHDHGTQCLRPSTVADHHPRSRRELEAAGLDPNDPAYGRGLCKGCHDRHTAAAQPGGWNQAR
ncbi:hypothetical protein [Micromonospora zhanjiangensis]